MHFLSIYRSHDKFFLLLFTIFFIESTLNSGSFNLRHPTFTNFNPRHVVFRGIKFQSKEALLASDFRNSSSIRKNLADVLAEIECLNKCQAVVRISKEEALSEGSILSPILWIVQDKPGGVKKNRLIHHDRLREGHFLCKRGIPKTTRVFGSVMI